MCWGFFLLLLFCFSLFECFGGKLTMNKFSDILKRSNLLMHFSKWTKEKKEWHYKGHQLQPHTEVCSRLLGFGPMNVNVTSRLSRNHHRCYEFSFLGATSLLGFAWNGHHFIADSVSPCPQPLPFVKSYPPVLMLTLSTAIQRYAVSVYGCSF